MTLITSSSRVLFRTAGALILTASLAMSTSAFSQDSKVLAKVGDRVITEADLVHAETDLAQQFKSVPADKRRARILDSLIDIHVFSINSEKEGIADEKDVKARIALLRSRALHNAYFQAKIQSSVSDADLKARYDTETAKATPAQEVSARHILVKGEDEALAIVKELDGGADFIELAKKKSTGPSGPKGGDLGYFGRGRMVPAFEAAAFELAKGAYTKTPVKTQFGFHIIKVDDKRDQPLPSFDASKEQLRQVMLAEKYSSIMAESRNTIGVEVLDKSLALTAPAK